MNRIDPGRLTAPTARVPALLAEASPHVLVVGDVILDGWWHGRSERLCREAPAPVVDLERRDYAAGGAANTAVNVARLGGRASVLGLVGADAAGGRLRALLSDAGVEPVLETHPGATTTKYRIVGGDQLLLRLDDQDRHPDPAALEGLAGRLRERLPGADVVVVCDYAAGALEGPVREALEEELAGRADGPLVLVDAHDPARWAGLRPDLATPNAAEAARLLGVRPDPDGDRAALFASRAADLLAAAGADHVVATLDRDGTQLVSGDGTGHRTWARPTTEKQASGAGDTFVACLAVALGAGLPLTTSIDLAQTAADVVVHRQGTSVCTTADLAAHLGGLADAAIGADELEREVARHRAEGRRIVLTNGCFDVLHRGHTRYLEQAKQQGDVLVVAVNDDASTRRIKGPDRPINTAADRAAVLAALNCVDHVTVFGTDTPAPLIERLRPDVYAKGGDYTEQMLAEAAVVSAYGGRVAILDYVSDHSTSGLVRRIRNEGADGGAEGSVGGAAAGGADGTPGRAAAGGAAREEAGP